MKLITDAQMGLLIRLNGGERVRLEEVNTMTLASTMRRGIVKPVRRQVRLTPLGEQTYEFHMNRRIRAWKKDLAEARSLKQRISR